MKPNATNLEAVHLAVFHVSTLTVESLRQSERSLKNRSRR